MQFERKLNVEKIEVYETYHAGGIANISYYDAKTSEWVEVYSAVATSLQYSKILTVNTANVC